MSDPDHCRKLENMTHSAPFIRWTGVRTKIEKGRSEIRPPMQEKMFHAANALHGPLYFLAPDNAAFFAINSLVKDVFAPTASFDICLTRPVTRGTLAAAGTAATPGKGRFIAEAVLRDEKDREGAWGGGIFVKGPTSPSPETGYA
ncbi:MAG: PaaI family thioesterase [Desulfococcaceae bacterium]